MSEGVLPGWLHRPGGARSSRGPVAWSVGRRRSAAKAVQVRRSRVVVSPGPPEERAPPGQGTPTCGHGDRRERWPSHPISADPHAASSEGISCGVRARVDWSSQRFAYTGEPQSGGGRGRSEVVRTEIPPPARLRRVSQDPGKLVPTGLSQWDRHVRASAHGRTQISWSTAWSVRSKPFRSRMVRVSRARPELRRTTPFTPKVSRPRAK